MGTKFKVGDVVQNLGGEQAIVTEVKGSCISSAGNFTLLPVFLFELVASAQQQAPAPKAQSAFKVGDQVHFIHVPEDRYTVTDVRGNVVCLDGLDLWHPAGLLELVVSAQQSPVENYEEEERAAIQEEEHWQRICFKYLDEQYFTVADPFETSKASSRCECGADKIGSNLHSDWCPKHE